MKSKNKMTIIRLILDILLLCGTVTLFSKQLISMKYHEIAGLVVIAVMLIHIGINLKMVHAIQNNFLKVPFNLKLCLIIDILLLLGYLFIGISGVMISKTILTGISSHNMIFKQGHTFCAALCVIFLGIHIGLHIGRKNYSVPLSIVLSIFIIAFGVFSFINTNELRWLSSPFINMESRPDEGMYMHQGEGHSFNSSDISIPDNNDINIDGNNKPQINDFSEHAGKENKNQTMNHGFEKNQSSGLNRFLIILEYLFMILSFTVVTYWCMYIKRNSKLKKSI